MAIGITNVPSPVGVSTLAGVTTLAVTVTTGNIALPGAGGNANVVTLINDGAAEVFVALGADNTVAAVATGIGLTSIPIPANARMCIYTKGAAWLAAITGASTATLRILVGNGPFFG